MSKQLLLKQRSFLKWAGGKFRLLDEIKPLLPQNKSCLIEPFVGAGSVFLNSHYEHYILTDVNPDLITVFNMVKEYGERYVQATRKLFEHSQANTPEYYYSLRQEFNQTNDLFYRAILFLYLNRFGYNGLCRYNKRKEYNVPFGSYTQHYFPENELRFFHKKAQQAEFICADFQQSFAHANSDSVIYCDPPYAPLQQSSNFTHYAGNHFDLSQQETLAKLARVTMLQHQITVIISNHDTPFTRKIYQGAKIKSIQVQRSISQNAKQRTKVKELIAVYSPKKQHELRT